MLGDYWNSDRISESSVFHLVFTFQLKFHWKVPSRILVGCSLAEVASGVAAKNLWRKFFLLQFELHFLRIPACLHTIKYLSACIILTFLPITSCSINISIFHRSVLTLTPLILLNPLSCHHYHLFFRYQPSYVFQSSRSSFL